MKRTSLCLLCLVLLPSGLYSAELAKDGATGWKIVLPDEPTIVEKTAARELSEHLKLVTGADFQTIAEKDVPADGTVVDFRRQYGEGPEEGLQVRRNPDQDGRRKPDSRRTPEARLPVRGLFVPAGRRRRSLVDARRDVHSEEADAGRRGRPGRFLRAADDLARNVPSKGPADRLLRPHEGQRVPDPGIRRRGPDHQFRPFVLQVSPAGKVLRRPSGLVLGNRRQTQA